MSEIYKKGRISIWLGQTRVPPEVDLLRDLCRISTYNVDDQEVSVDSRTWKKQSVDRLLKQISYSSSFLDNALEAAAKHNITEALYAICQFDFAYSRRVDEASEPNDPVFIGHFHWDDAEDDM